MFKIEAFDASLPCKELELNPDLFHHALREGDRRFHVRNPRGDSFDLVYYDNNDDLEPLESYPAYVKGPYMASYRIYDETDKDTLYLGFFDGLKSLEFEELNEYTIALTRVVLACTDMEVYCTDQRVCWFIPENERLHVVPVLPVLPGETTFYIQAQMRTGLEDRNFNILSSVYAFHNVFFFQWILKGRKPDGFRYITMDVGDDGGIGAVLAYCKRFDKAFSCFGLKFITREERLGKFKVDMLSKYFSLGFSAADATDENTLVIPNQVMVIVRIKLIYCQSGAADVSILAPRFREEMDEYYKALFEGRKVLGILIRGTDYISSGMSGDRLMATVPQMIPVIHRWIDEDHYDRIFLATEDADILKQMKDEFGKMVIAVAQERHSVSEFRKDEVISELEKETLSGDDYDNTIEDTTINYFYALYLLSRSDSFMCSGKCNGWDVVNDFNGGKFLRSYKFNVAMNGDPRTEDWEEVMPVYAGMFARAAYPTGKAFYMTYHFELDQPTDGEMLRKAWDQTVKVYPYLSWAVVLRNGKYAMARNDLPFVIRETEEIIEPFKEAGNFHTAAIGYKGNRLCFYIDHVPFDGTGVQFVLETFFYCYFCLKDGTAYPVPEDVLTEKDIPVEGLAEDAYLAVDPIDPQGLAQAFMGQGTFVTPESPAEGIFVPMEDCGRFCISVPKEELMEYAGKVSGSPMAVIAVLMAKAMEKVHPENTLPVKITSPVSVRRIMGNTHSLQHQVVHTSYQFSADELKAEGSHEKLIRDYRTHLKGFMTEQNIRMMCGVYSGIVQGMLKAQQYHMLDKVIMEQRENMGAGIAVSYLGILRTGEYGKRIRMTAFHAMQEKGIMLQAAEIGGTFYLCWYQGFRDDCYVRAMTEEMTALGMPGARFERA